MYYMKKSICAILVVIILTLSFSSCLSDKLTETNSQHILLEACVRYSVPGFYKEDTKGPPSPKVVETDDYGRILVAYEGYNKLTETDECVYVICQKYENSTVYFYEDINYEWIGKETTDIEGFKKDNDWNKEIDESKLSKRKVNINTTNQLVKNSVFSGSPSSPDYRSREKLLQSLLENCSIESELIIVREFCDWDEKDWELYICILDNGDKYFFVTDLEYNTYAAKIEDPYDTSDTVHSLKEQCGWHYGT